MAGLGGEADQPIKRIDRNKRECVCVYVRCRFLGGCLAECLIGVNIKTWQKGGACPLDVSQPLAPKDSSVIWVQKGGDGTARSPCSCLLARGVYGLYPVRHGSDEWQGLGLGLALAAVTMLSQNPSYLDAALPDGGEGREGWLPGPATYVRSASWGGESMLAIASLATPYPLSSRRTSLSTSISPRFTGDAPGAGVERPSGWMRLSSCEETRVRGLESGVEAMAMSMG